MIFGFTNICNITVLFLSVLLCLVLVFPWPTLPGAGMTLTINMLVWLCVAGWGVWLVGWSRWHRPKGMKIIALLFAGASLMTIPLLWTTSQYLENCLGRLLGIWGLVLLLFILLQHPLSREYKSKIYLVIVIAGLLQFLIACWQILRPTSAAKWLGYSFSLANGRPLGSLMQVNLLGSFLATSLLCALLLACCARTRLRSAGMWLCVVTLGTGVIITESRTGMLGVVVGVAVIITTKRNQRIYLLSFIALVSALAFSHMLLVARPAQLVLVAHQKPISPQLADPRPTGTEARLEWNHRHSESERHAMVIGSLAMISEHPITGYGLGTFEISFPVVLARNAVANPFTVSVEYPHNEIMYVWSEGGVVALTGLLLCMLTIASPLMTLTKPQVLMRGALLLPILLHMMTEYPLYLSAVHGVLLVILFWLAVPAKSKIAGCAEIRLTPSAHTLLRLSLVIICFFTICYMFIGLQSARHIYKIEHGRPDRAEFLTNVMPYAQQERLLFDRAIGDLMRFNSLRNSDSLEDFYKHASEWLSRHNDANLNATMMQVGSLLKKPDVKYWRWRGCLSFPQDPRFACGPVDGGIYE